MFPCLCESFGCTLIVPLPFQVAFTFIMSNLAKGDRSAQVALGGTCKSSRCQKSTTTSNWHKSQNHAVLDLH